MPADFGILSILPTCIVLVLAIVLRKTFESLVIGAIIGFIIIDPSHFFDVFINTTLHVMQDDIMGWIILVCGLFGSLIFLLVQSGGAMAFAHFLLRYVKNRNSALTVTWLLGLCIFIDDYLNALTVGTSMKKITDKFKIPREMLAYVVDATAAPVCIIIPLSTWAIYISGLLEDQNIVPAGEGMSGYLRAIPYMIYGWVAACLVPLVIYKIIPAIGPMKKAEQRAKEGQLIPPNSKAIALEIEEKKHPEQASLFHFILPILVLIAATLYFDIDALKGIIITLVFSLIYFTLSGVFTINKAIEGLFEGFKVMLYPLAIILMSFVIKEMNDQLGLAPYVIKHLKPYMSSTLLPVLTFISLSIATFATGSFWGVYAISFPVILPLAASIGVHPWLAIGTVVSAGAFGSHACFYGDTTILSASATGCNNMAHIFTQLPYTLIGGAITALIYIILGYML